VSPRSTEFMDQARDRAVLAREAIVAGAADYIAAVERMLETQGQDPPAEGEPPRAGAG
jgi:hypothetical protein